jgi:hypothetical protein
VVFKSVLFIKEPPVLELHDPEVALPLMLPLRIIASELQTVKLVPASTIASGLTVIITVSEAGPQGPEGLLVVKVNVTVPEVIAGVYVAFRSDVLEKLPLGALQVADEALPPIDPFRSIVPSLHIV